MQERYSVGQDVAPRPCLYEVLTDPIVATLMNRDDFNPAGLERRAIRIRSGCVDPLCEAT